ncbi:MAG TPA: ester cyclase [Bauldia sp.]|nr:ester cyclase [Bauldia sp.]
MKRFARTLLVVAFAAAPFVPVALADDAANEALVKRFYDALNTRNYDGLGEFMAADFVDHNAPPGVPPGLEGLKLGLKQFLILSSDVQISNGPIVVKDNYVTVWDTIRGTNNGDFMGMKATNKPFEFHALDLWLIKDGKLAEGWHVEDQLSLLMQIGALGGPK